jgi:WD40 repeat protein
MYGHEGDVFSIDISPDGQTLASGGADGTMRLWDIRSGKEKGQAFGGYEHWIWNVAYNLRGEMVATASVDGTVRLWDLDSSSWIRKACAIANRSLSEDEWRRFVGTDIPYVRVCP